MTFRVVGALAAVALILLPIGGLFAPQAGVSPASAQSASSAQEAAGDAPAEPTALLLICVGGVAVLARRAVVRRKDAGSA